MNYRLNADEIACIKKLAKLFEKNDIWISDEFHGEPNGPSHPLELLPGNRDSILSMLEQMELITDVQHSTEGSFLLFRIDAKAVQIARELAEQESKQDESRDIVEHVKNITRRNRIFAWAIIVFSVLTGLMIFVNQLLQLLKTLGMLKTD